MKSILVIALVAACPLWAAAQRNNTFADVGITGDITKPGASLTYNLKPVKYFGVGLGAQGYNYSIENRAGTKTTNQFTPALFADLRGYLPVKRSLFFIFFDAGLAINRNTDSSIAPVHGDAFYTGLGIGYCYRINKRGIGPYISLKVVSDTYKSVQLNTVTGETNSETNVDGTSVIAIGFKF